MFVNEIEGIEKDEDEVFIKVEGTATSRTEGGYTEEYPSSDNVYVSKEKQEQLLYELAEVLGMTVIDSQTRVTSNSGNAVIDVSHSPDAEAALVQETRERLAMLQRHVGSPEAVASLEQLDEDLEAIMYTIARTDKYECGCSLIKDDR